MHDVEHTRKSLFPSHASFLGKYLEKKNPFFQDVLKGAESLTSLILVDVRFRRAAVPFRRRFVSKPTGCLAIRFLMYRRNISEYRDTIFLSYHPALVVILDARLKPNIY